MEVFNESCICFCSYIVLMFCDINLSPLEKLNIGWVFIGVVAINVVANISIMGYFSSKLLWKKYKQKCRRKKTKKAPG